MEVDDGNDTQVTDALDRDCWSVTDWRRPESIVWVESSARRFEREQVRTDWTRALSRNPLSRLAWEGNKLGVLDAAATPPPPPPPPPPLPPAAPIKEIQQTSRIQHTIRGIVTCTSNSPSFYCPTRKNHVSRLLYTDLDFAMYCIRQFEIVVPGNGTAISDCVRRSQ